MVVTTFTSRKNTNDQQKFFVRLTFFDNAAYSACAAGGEILWLQRSRNSRTLCVGVIDFAGNIEIGTQHLGPPTNCVNVRL